MRGVQQRGHPCVAGRRLQPPQRVRKRHQPAAVHACQPACAGGRRARAKGLFGKGGRWARVMHCDARRACMRGCRAPRCMPASLSASAWAWAWTAALAPCPKQQHVWLRRAAARMVSAMRCAVRCAPLAHPRWRSGSAPASAPAAPGPASLCWPAGARRGRGACPAAAHRTPPCGQPRQQRGSWHLAPGTHAIRMTLIHPSVQHAAPHPMQHAGPSSS